MYENRLKKFKKRKVLYGQSEEESSAHRPNAGDRRASCHRTRPDVLHLSFSGGGKNNMELLEGARVSAIYD